MSKRVLATAILSAALIFAPASLTPAGARPAPAPQRTAPGKKPAPRRYACPMHPEVNSHRRGKCPKCGMSLTEAGADAAAPGAPGQPAPAPEGPAPLLQVPDTTVYDQHGQRRSFYTDLVKGKTVAINFIFTTCNGVCPPMTARMRKVQQELGDRVGRDVELISISVDPTTDVPERLKGFADKFKAGPGWTFVTGSKPEIDQLLKALGASAAQISSHTPMILVGNDATGYWTRAHGLSPTSMLVKVISEAAAGGPARARNGATPGAAGAAGNDGGGVRQVPVPGGEDSGPAAPERRVNRRPAPATSPGAEKAAAGAGKVKTLAEASAGYFPNTVLLTQDGKPVRFYDDLLKGKVVLINFVFTTCAGVCPPMTANLAKVQRYLGERVGREVVMISISVDPAVDTPEALKRYAEKFKAQPGWYFLTGSKENVDRVLSKLGGYVDDKVKHSSVLIIGNEATGEWVKSFAMAKPGEIAAAVTELLGTQKQ